MLYRITKLFSLILFTVIMSHQLEQEVILARLDASYVSSYEFRSLQLDEKFIQTLQNNTTSDIGESVALYLLENSWGDVLSESQWNQSSYWSTYVAYCASIFQDLQYFPVPESTSNSNATVSYVNSWGDSRSYGGERIHEGTDLMANVDVAGYYPVVSVSDGVVTNIGWLEQGGYRVGITSESGVYFYYAHLDSYSGIEQGDEVVAGQLLGYMGDSGYGEEGTTGMFPVHLHFGIYITVDGEEISVNPYWILRFLDAEKLKYSF